eukprot:757535-Hanusia_phi.AAC.1
MGGCRGLTAVNDAEERGGDWDGRRRGGDQRKKKARISRVLEVGREDEEVPEIMATKGRMSTTHGMKEGQREDGTTLEVAVVLS